MSGGKETPRQKMIGMMYLVLTALLALNVSKDILNAFVMVNSGLVITNETFEKKNTKVYNDFNAQENANKAKVKPFNDAAKEVRKLTEEQIKEIDKLKGELIEHVEGKENLKEKVADIAKIDSKDNYDVPTHVMCGDGTDINKGEAHKLKLALIKYKADLLKIFDRKDMNIPDKAKKALITELATLGIDTEDPKIDPKKAEEDPFAKKWETAKFYHAVLVAQITQLSKIQNDVRNAESQVLGKLWQQITAEDFKFDKIDAKVVTSSKMVTKGGKYEAELFVAAYNSNENPVVTVDGANVPCQQGVAKYEVSCGAVGDFKKKVIIKIKTPSGEEKPYETELDYKVMEPAMVVSPTKMNVFYIGVDNPVDVSVSGFANEDVKPSIDGGFSISKVKGASYIVKVSKPGKAIISVSVKDKESTKSIGKMEFRVKRVPDPVAKIANQKEGRVPKNKLLAQQGVIAELENFDFDIVFKVKSFVLSATIDGFTKEVASESNRFTDGQMKLLGAVKKSQKVYFDNIVALGPDGTPRKLSPVILVVD